MMQRSLSERLRVLRARRGLSLTEAAERAGVTRDTISDLERGKRRAYMPTLTKIAKGYRVPVEELLEEPVGAGKAEAPSPGPATAEETTGSTEDAEERGEELRQLRKLLSNVRASLGEIVEMYKDKAAGDPDKLEGLMHILIFTKLDAMQFAQEITGSQKHPANKRVDLEAVGLSDFVGDSVEDIREDIRKQRAGATTAERVVVDFVEHRRRSMAG